MVCRDCRRPARHPAERRRLARSLVPRVWHRGRHPLADNGQRPPAGLEARHVAMRPARHHDRFPDMPRPAAAALLGLAVCGKSHPWPFSTQATPQKAKVFGGRRSPHPAAADVFHSLRTVRVRACPQAPIGAARAASTCSSRARSERESRSGSSPSSLACSSERRAAATCCPASCA